jgi:7-cyano-7-deazaguanine synthase
MRTTAVLLSGGVDSIALAFWKRPDLAFTIDYGQLPAAAELQASREVCKEIGVAHEVITVDCSSIGSGDLTTAPPLQMAPSPEWWPFRNQLLLTIAAARSVGLGIKQLLIGTVASDRVHADGTPTFVATIAQLMSMQEGAITVDAPAIAMSSAQLVRLSGVPLGTLAWAHSCHVANLACGRCRGCAKHFSTMRELDLDPY